MTTRAPTGKAPVKGEPGFVPLYPPYMEEGSDGPAVDDLWKQLEDAGCTNGLKFTPYIFDGQVTVAVKRRQRQMGWRKPKDVDGKWGPGTRARHIRHGGVDVDAIPYDWRAGRTTYFHEGVNCGQWPLESAA